MRQSSYLNTILTVNAVLLAGLLWTALAGRPLFAESASAQNSSRPRPSGLVTPPVPNVPNASAQRYTTINELREIKSMLKSTRQLLESGQIKVNVTNIDQINRK
jgi:hypothetical protein